MAAILTEAGLPVAVDAPPAGAHGAPKKGRLRGEEREQQRSPIYSSGAPAARATNRPGPGPPAPQTATKAATFLQCPLPMKGPAHIIALPAVDVFLGRATECPRLTCFTSLRFWA